MSAQNVEIIVGDCRETLRALPDASAQCVVTSPPYFGLRDYGHADQIGLEPTPDEFIAALVAVFREVRRVLRDDGTVWLNLGDSYVSVGSGTQGAGGEMATRRVAHVRDRKSVHSSIERPPSVPGLAQKQLIGIPWRVAFGLQADGWWLRQDIIWSKPNPMPESVTDRCTKAHEYVFLLTKSARYFYDAKAVKEPGTNRPPGNTKPTKGGRALQDGDGYFSTAGNLHKIEAAETRNRRSVWTITTQPYDGAHFATMPPKLAETCILAGSRRGDTVLDPFGGAGTTGLVAARHGRRAILCELNPEYASLARERINREWGEHKPEPTDDLGPLFAGAAE